MAIRYTILGKGNVTLYNKKKKTVFLQETFYFNTFAAPSKIK